VILNSHQKTRRDEYKDLYQLKVPIHTPYNYVGLAQLETCVLKAPSLFNDDIVNNINNAMIDNENILSYEENIKPTLQKCMYMDMSNAYNLVDALVEIVQNSKSILYIEFPGTHSLDIETNQPWYLTSTYAYDSAYPDESHWYVTLDYTDPTTTNTNSAGVVIEQWTYTRIGSTRAAINDTGEEFSSTWMSGNDTTGEGFARKKLAERLESYGEVSIRIGLNNVVNTRRLTLSGPWLKIFGAYANNTTSYTLKGNNRLIGYPHRVLNNNLLTIIENGNYAEGFVNLNNYTVSAGQNRNFPADVDGDHKVAVTLKTEGYTFLNIHTNMGRAIMQNNSDETGLIPSNVFASMPIAAEPFNSTYYSNFGTGGRIPFHTPMLEEIYIYFTDEFGDLVGTLPNYTMVITFDFLEKGEQPPQVNTATERTQQLAALQMNHKRKLADFAML